MPGAVEIDPSTIRPPTDIAYKDSAGNWRAGPQAKGYEQGQFVDASYANKARKFRQNTNLTKQFMRSNDLDEAEAREQAREMISRLKEADSEEERKDIRQNFIES